MNRYRQLLIVVPWIFLSTCTTDSTHSDVHTNEYEWQLIRGLGESLPTDYGYEFNAQGFDCALDRGTKTRQPPSFMKSRFLSCRKGEAEVRLITTCAGGSFDKQSLQLVDTETGRGGTILSLICSTETTERGLGDSQ